MMHSLKELLFFLPLLAHASPIRPDKDHLNDNSGIEKLFGKQIYHYDNSDQSILDLEPEDMPSWATTHLLARRLLGISKTGVLSTVYPASESANGISLSGVPIGLPDYFADCASNSNSSSNNSKLNALLGQGNPLILALNVATTVRNAKAGSNVSLSIDWWHGNSQAPDPSVSLAGLPRLSLLGTLEALDSDIPAPVHKEIENCFLASHPDSVAWLPGHEGAAHSGYWAKLVVQQAYWVGGFGDRARIGWLDMESWRSIRKAGKDGEEGWEDVRLPGEN